MYTAKAVFHLETSFAICNALQQRRIKKAFVLGASLVERREAPQEVAAVLRGFCRARGDGITAALSSMWHREKRRFRHPSKPHNRAFEKRRASRSMRGQGVATPCGAWGSAPQKRSYKREVTKEKLQN